MTVRNNILKALSLILVVTLVAASCLTCVFADDTLGSITVELSDSDTDKPITTGVLTLYKVASLNSNGSYTYTSDFASSGIELTVRESTLATLLTQWAVSQGVTGTVGTPNSDGKVTFSNLEVGLYLIVPTTNPTNYNMNPSLVSIPNVAGEGEYDVMVEAKLESTYIPTTPDEPTPTTTTVVTEPDVVVTTEGTNTEEGKTDEEVDIEEDEPEEKDEDTLPQTGQLNYPIPIMAGAGVFCVAAGLIVVRTDKKK